MIPFSQRERDANHEYFVCFYEKDVNFREILTLTEDFVDDLRQHRTKIVCEMRR